jgi:hypothetical protein
MSFKENAFPLGKGKLNLTSGTRTDMARVYWCVDNGTLTITWSDASTTDIDLVSGDAVKIENTATSVEIVSGTFHVA